MVSILEDEDFQSADIFISPPEDASKSDEDSGPEDDEGDVNNLSGNQLRARAEASIHLSGFNHKYLGVNDNESESEEEEASSTAVTGECLNKRRRRSVPQTPIITMASTVKATAKNEPLPAAVASYGDGGEKASAAVTGEQLINRRRKSINSAATIAAALRTISQKKTVTPARKWVSRDLKEPEIPWNASVPQIGSMDRTPSSFFELFFDDAVIEHITQMTNMYAMQNSKQLGATASEIRLTIAILLISGYIPLANRRMYWELSEDVHNEAVSSAMPLNRFEELLRFIHVCDNTNLDATDKLTKLRPLYLMLNERFLQHWPVEQDVSIDESMVPYYGRHSSKQFIRGKPVRFGFKVWCLNSRLGYLIQCDPYQGSSGIYNADLGLGGSVVTQLLSKLQKGLNYRLYVDNFFTSTRLLDHLKKQNIFVTGTVRANRMEKCPLKDVDKMKKEVRGTHDLRLDTKSGMMAVRWNDNSVVNMLSNCCGVHPLNQVKRWSAAEKKFVQIPQPHLVSQYNRFMAGTDRMDQNIAHVRINIRIKKWWWALFCFTIDVSMQNAWQLYRMSEAAQRQPMTLVQFRRNVAMTYVMKYRNVTSGGRPVRNPSVKCRKVSPEVRHDGLNHFNGRIDGGQKRCAQCSMKVQKRCTKCGVALHDRCFELFHARVNGN